MRSLYTRRSRLIFFFCEVKACLTSDEKMIVMPFLCAKREPGLTTVAKVKCCF
jgi:hypothetical protein